MQMTLSTVQQNSSTLPSKLPIFGTFVPFFTSFSEHIMLAWVMDSLMEIVGLPIFLAFGVVPHDFVLPRTELARCFLKCLQDMT